MAQLISEFEETLQHVTKDPDMWCDNGSSKSTELKLK